MKCACCGEYYRRTRYNPTDHCEACIDDLDETEVLYDEDADFEIRRIVNGSGKTLPIFYD